MFVLHTTDAFGVRHGTLTTAHGAMATPFFMPIATKGAVKTLPPHVLFALQQSIDPTTTPIVLSNTYHLMLRPGIEVLQKLGGFHGLCGWQGALLTDSGGFQIFSLERLRRVDDHTVVFRSHIDGSEHILSPEQSMEVQQAIGADVCMAFDYFPGFPATNEHIAESVARTTAWALRCQKWWQTHSTQTQQLFGIIQGGTNDEFRKHSAQELVKMNFDGYAIGGLAVGESAEEMLRVCALVAPLLPSDKPRYLMGVGLPEQILEATKRGIDMFDCVIPTRNARHGTLFVQTEKHILAPDRSRVIYERIRVRAQEYVTDDAPMSVYCQCSVCQHPYSRAFVRHLFSIDDPLAQYLATIHNIAFYMQLMQELRA